VLSEVEINRMIQQAEEFSQIDRQQKARVEKRNRADSMASQAERKLREVALDFGMYFAEVQRRKIEALIRDLRQAVKNSDDRAIDLTQASLQDALYELDREVALRVEEEEGGDFFQPLKDTLTTLQEANPLNQNKRRDREGSRPGRNPNRDSRDSRGNDRSRRDRFGSDRDDRDPRRSPYAPRYDGNEEWGDDDEWF
jgi:molecular chaperone DnaK